MRLLSQNVKGGSVGQAHNLGAVKWRRYSRYAAPVSNPPYHASFTRVEGAHPTREGFVPKSGTRICGGAWVPEHSTEMLRRGQGTEIAMFVAGLHGIPLRLCVFAVTAALGAFHGKAVADD